MRSEDLSALLCRTCDGGSPDVGLAENSVGLAGCSGHGADPWDGRISRCAGENDAEHDAQQFMKDTTSLLAA